MTSGVKRKKERNLLASRSLSDENGFQVESPGKPTSFPGMGSSHNASVLFVTTASHHEVTQLSSLTSRFEFIAIYMQKNNNAKQSICFLNRFELI